MAAELRIVSRYVEKRDDFVRRTAADDTGS